MTMHESTLETRTETQPAPEALLREHFGFSAFREGQRAVVEALLDPARGRALAVFPTGGGKSLCYQLPALALPGLTLVISPLIALMKDQIGFLQSRGIAAARLDSSLTAEESRQVSAGLRNGTLKLLYVAPERFNNERFLETLRRTKIALFAVDEAHCISEWGHNFRPDYLKLAQAARDLGVARVLALTATASPAVVTDICEAFAIPRADAVITGSYRPNLTLLTTPVRPADRDRLLLERLRSRPAGPAIVYVTLQKTAEKVAERLRVAGLPAEAYHAGMEAEERAAVQDRWMASPGGVAVATIAFGMGIDKADVRYVYHYNLPKSLESYSQEIGRAGRDGLPSTVELFAAVEDVPVLENFAYGDTPTVTGLRGLVRDVLDAGEEFALNLYDLSVRHDLRQTVLRTALTYLELLGVMRQGTPYYASYRVRPFTSPEAVAGTFKGEPAEFIRTLFRVAKPGRTWYTVTPDEAAVAMDQPRERVVRCLEVLEERGLAEVQASDVRHRYVRVDGGRADAEELTAELVRRFERREAQEIARLQQVLDLVTADACQVNVLAAHFGEERREPCGHCTWCLTGKPQRLFAPQSQPPLAGQVDMEALRELRKNNPAALGEPRQIARYLTGLISPAASRARLGGNPLFGSLDHRRFAEVLQWAEEFVQHEG